MKTQKSSLVRVAAFLGVAAVMVWGLAGTALAGLSLRSGLIPAGETAGAAPLADDESGGPAISGVAVENVTETGATIVWETDVLATSQVDYGPTAEYGSTATSGLYATSHRVSVGGLATRTEYHYKVVSTGMLFSGTTQSADFTFTTLAPPDQAGPVISGVRSENVTASSALIVWSTDEEADSQVQYGSSTSYGSGTMADATLTRYHAVALTGLVYGTQYHCRVKSADALGNLSESADFTFTTIDNMPPVISQAKLVDVTTTTATLTWTTDERSDSQAEYGLDIYYGFTTPLDTAPVTRHRVTITGLTPGTWYNCRGTSRDASGNLAQSADCEFLTPDETVPVIANLIVTGISASEATVRWETDERTSSLVEYGLTANYGSKASEGDSLLLNHNVSLSKLSAQTTYHYRVKSTDYWGNWTVSPDATFTTTDVNAPVISSVTATAITDNSAIIVWTTDSAAEGIVEYGPRASYGLVSSFDTRLVTGHSIVLSGLEPGTTYHFKVKSRDASGLWAASTDRTFTTGGGSGAGEDGVAAPQISKLTAAEITSSGATIYWSTSRPATSRVEYGLTDEYGAFTAADADMDTSHYAPLTDLRAGTTYHYRVISRDAAGNETVSVDQTFTTGMGRAPLPSLPGWAWTIIGITGAMAVGVMVVKNR